MRRVGAVIGRGGVPRRALLALSALLEFGWARRGGLGAGRVAGAGGLRGVLSAGRAAGAGACAGVGGLRGGISAGRAAVVGFRVGRSVGRAAVVGLRVVRSAGRIAQAGADLRGGLSADHAKQALRLSLGRAAAGLRVGRVVGCVGVVVAAHHDERARGPRFLRGRLRQRECPCWASCRHFARARFASI